jgi:hypothetical protein
MKVRRRLIEKKVAEFMDACEFLVDHPLLLWAPEIETRAAKLVKAVSRLQRRTALARAKPSE